MTFFMYETLVYTAYKLGQDITYFELENALVFSLAVTCNITSCELI